MRRATAAARARRAPVLLLLIATGLLGGCEPSGAGARGEAAADTTLLGRIRAVPPAAETLRLVRLRARGEQSAFEPGQVSARPGDVLRFVQTTLQPATVQFDTLQAPPGGPAFLARVGALRGVLLTRPGQRYDVPLSDAPRGRYVFRAVPGGGEGVLLVQ